MSSNRSPWLIVGPIIGFILLYVIIRYGVTELQNDLAQLDEFGVATLQEVQHAGMAEELEAADEEPTEAESTEEAVSEETTVAEDVAEDVVEEATTDEPAAEEESTSSD